MDSKTEDMVGMLAGVLNREVEEKERGWFRSRRFSSTQCSICVGKHTGINWNKDLRVIRWMVRDRGVAWR